METLQPDVPAGKDLERRASIALMHSGLRVEGEQLIAGKRVDLVTRQMHFGREWVTAVECKDLDHKLGRAEVVKIWADYEPLVLSQAVNELLIITRLGLSPAAEAFVTSRPNLIAQRLDALLGSLVDFGPYMESLVRNFNDGPDGLSHYYQPPKVQNSKIDIESCIHAWISGLPNPLNLTAERPVAILGDYGSGKSSFSSYLAANLAARRLASGQDRVPILIRLAQIGAEQSLEGLLGHHLAALVTVPGYNFGLFDSLNRDGAFVIILDGFDEMRQLLSWRAFRYNLSQLNRLVVPNSRVVLLGRPTAFEDDDQQAFALHGIRQGPLGTAREAGSPDYFEVRIGQWDLDMMRNFLNKYTTYRRARDGLRAPTRAYLAELWESVSSRWLRDMASRPVQLRMLAEVLPSFTGDIRKLGLAQLYDLFISDLTEQIVQREENKQARLAFSARERRDFARRLAFWLWNTEVPRVFEDRISRWVIEPYLGREPEDQVRRDLLAGAPVDRLPGSVISFPHRSIQEFLVAEQAWLELLSGALSIEQLDGLLTDEVSGFMLAVRGDFAESAWLREKIDVFSGPLHWRTAQVLWFTPDIINHAMANIRSNVKPNRVFEWQLLLATLRSLDERETRGRVLKARDLESLCRAAAGSDRSLLAVLFSTMCLAARDREAFSGSVTTALSAIAEPSGEEREFGVADVESAQLKELPHNLVCTQSYRNLRFGRIITRQSEAEAHILASVGSRRIRIRWYSELALDVAQALAVDANGDLTLSGLRAVFGRWLASASFVSDWVKNGTLTHDIETLRFIPLEEVGLELPTLLLLGNECRAHQRAFPNPVGYSGK